MRLIYLGPRNLGQELNGFASRIGWNLTSTEWFSEAIAFIKKTEFQAIFIFGNQGALDCSQVTELLSVSNAPIVACISENTPERRARVLELGAATCLSVPTDNREFQATTIAMVRVFAGAKSNKMEAGNLVLDLEEQCLYGYGSFIPLSAKEYQLMELLFLRRNRLVTRIAIMNHLYDGMEEPDLKIIDVLICRVRKKLSAVGADSETIVTIRGQGYRLTQLQTNTIRQVKSGNIPNRVRSCERSVAA